MRTVRDTAQGALAPALLEEVTTMTLLRMTGCALVLGLGFGLPQAEAAPIQNGLHLNALTQNALTQNALTQNALTQNALTQNALTQNAAAAMTGSRETSDANDALATLNGVIVEAVVLPGADGR